MKLLLELEVSKNNENHICDFCEIQELCSSNQKDEIYNMCTELKANNFSIISTKVLSITK